VTFEWRRQLLEATLSTEDRQRLAAALGRIQQELFVYNAFRHRDGAELRLLGFSGGDPRICRGHRLDPENAVRQSS
jgi:hypothetical protein